MTGVSSFEAMAQFIPGLTQYRYSMANMHRLQHGRIAPVPAQRAPRMKIDPKQLEYFLGFITSPHMVQDLPFGEKSLQLSSRKVINVPNVIRSMISERSVAQYTKYYAEVGFTPFSRSAMLRVLSECSASVRKSLQGLDYFAAEGSRAFDDLASIVQEIALLRADGVTWGPISMIQESLKVGKLYLKSDYKVCHTNSNTRLYTPLTLAYGHSNSFCVKKRETKHKQLDRGEVTDQSGIATQIITSNGTVIYIISLAVLGFYRVEIYTARFYFCNLCPFFCPFATYYTAEL